MKKIITDIINKLDQADLDYADVRYTSTDEQQIYFEKGELKYFGSDLESPALVIWTRRSI